MTLKQTRQQILLNRKILSTMYATLADVKADKRHWDDVGNIEAEYAAHNYLKWLRKQIASLVVLQKALKADLAWTLAIDAASRA
jgi:hypothetical protein